MIRKESDVDVEKIKSMNIAYGDAGKNPMLAALQSSSHKNNISSVTDYLTKGLELIAKAKEMYKQQPQGDLFMPKESVNEDDQYAAAEAASKSMTFPPVPARWSQPACRITAERRSSASGVGAKARCRTFSTWKVGAVP